MQTLFKGLTTQSPKALRVAELRAGAYAIRVQAEIKKGRRVKR